MLPKFNSKNLQNWRKTFFFILFFFKVVCWSMYSFWINSQSSTLQCSIIAPFLFVIDLQICKILICASSSISTINTCIGGIFQSIICIRIFLSKISFFIWKNDATIAIMESVNLSKVRFWTTDFKVCYLTLGCTLQIHYKILPQFKPFNCKNFCLNDFLFIWQKQENYTL